VHRIPSDAEWTRGRVDTLPPRWAKRLLDRWEATQAADYFRANADLRETTESLLRVRIPLDASDALLCEAAAELVRRCLERATIFHTLADVRASMERICAAQGIEAPHPKVKDACAVARMTCSHWWRRKLRKHHGRTLESAAIRLGRVSKRGDLYVSNEGLRMRLQQNARNAAAMESTLARNELGQEFTLAELAEKGSSNKKIRRAELMTRIAGFERFAVSQGHAGTFMTITCPSRFHRFRTVNGGKLVIDNPNYDPDENPGTAQRYLAGVWSRIRAKLNRCGLGVYGFRIAEPQHDGTPHWHFLLFHEAARASELEQIVREHALKDSPTEPGAKEHRCDFKAIDWSKGSAAAYVAKYVSKNIDGANVGEDFNGKPATETAVRVEAWAARWNIRQFQQIGGPPVGVWRELRRIPAIPLGAPRFLREAHAAANKVNKKEGQEKTAVAWDKYCEAQGGVFCGRDARIKLTKVAPEKLGRYGDDAAPTPVGVEASELELYAVPWNPGTWAHRRVHWVVPSVRHEWEIVRKTNPSGIGSSIAERAEPAQPWTGVNNCTTDARHCPVAAPSLRLADASRYGVEASAHPPPLQQDWNTSSKASVCDKRGSVTADRRQPRGTHRLATPEPCCDVVAECNIWPRTSS
jgi:hypothetical protein